MTIRSNGVTFICDRCLAEISRNGEDSQSLPYGWKMLNANAAMPDNDIPLTTLLCISCMIAWRKFWELKS